LSRSTYERSSDDFDLPVLEPRWPEPEVPTTTRRRGRPRPKLRRTYVAGLVITATVIGAAATHALDLRNQTPAPAPAPVWMAACQEAINATAQFHHLQNLQLAQGLQSVFALIAGVHPDTKSVDSATARLQRDAEEATARCISPAVPPA
jgi:hypothetical protein